MAVPEHLLGRRAATVGTAAQRQPLTEPGQTSLTRLLALQRSAGNRAVTGSLTNRRSIGHQATPTVQRGNEAPPGQSEQAVDDLYGWLVANAVNVQSLLMTLLLQKDKRVELRKRYDEKYHRSLMDDVRAKLSWDNSVRAQRYLEFGQLRLADKLFIAMHGKLTDEATLQRLAPEVNAARATAEDDFKASYSKEYPSDYELPDGKNSRTAGAVMSEAMWATFQQRFRIAAVLAFGAPRAADDVKIATVSGTNNSALLFGALQREDPKQIAKDFQASYKSEIKDYLSRETSLHTKARALLFFDENVKPEDRLLKTVEIATSGYTTADTDFIFDAVAHATPAQITKFKAALVIGDGRLKHLDDFFGGLNAKDRDRLNALVGIGEDSGILADPVVKQLRAQGGNGDGAVFEALRFATGPAHDAYRKAYNDAKTPFRNYVDQYTTAPEKGWLGSYVFTDFRPRLMFVMKEPGMDDYILFLLNSVADGAARKALATDAEFGTKFAALGTATQNKILLSLEPAQLTPAERAVWLDAAVKRETGSGAGALSGAAGALQDENRELQAAVARGGKNPSPEQQAEIDRLTSSTKDALTAFVQYRDELESALAGAVEMAAAMIATVLTGGVASVELALLAVARAAVASAMAKVVSNKIVKGDRFDVLGADGAQAFVSGAVDGMLNAVAPVVGKVGKGVAVPALEEAATVAARSSAPRAFQQFAASAGPKMAEGAITGGLSSAVDAATRDATWADGFDRGMREMLMSSVRGAFSSGALAGLPPSMAALVTAAGGLDAFEKIITALPDPEASLEEGVIDLEPASSAGAAPVQRVGDPAPATWGPAFEVYATDQIQANGLGGQLPKMEILVSGQIESGQGIDRIGFAYEGKTLRVYHFEMKWRNPPSGTNPPPKVGVDHRDRGIQTGQSWSVHAITRFCDGSTPETMAAREVLRATLPRKLGHPAGTIWSPEQLKSYLLKNLRTTRRVVVVPPHVNIKSLWMQLIALTRWDQRKSTIVTVGMRK